MSMTKFLTNVLIAIASLALVFGIVCLGGLLVMVAANIILGAFGVPAITFWQGVILYSCYKAITCKISEMVKE